MRTLAIWSTVLILATAVNAMAAEPKLETEEQKTLYALGLTINRSLSPFNLSPSELEQVEAGLAEIVDWQRTAPLLQHVQLPQFLVADTPYRLQRGISAAARV